MVSGRILYSILWIAGAVFFYGTSLIPAYYLIEWGNKLAYPWFLFIYPLALFLFIVTLMLLTGLVKLLFIPKTAEGEYNFPGDRQAKLWFINLSITQYLLVPFGRLIFLNGSLRYICLNLYGMKLPFTTLVSTSISLRDFDMIKIGSHTIIGGWAYIFGHYQPSRDRLITAKTEIGDYCFIGADSIVNCGTKIGNNVFAGARCIIGRFVAVGDNSKFDYNIFIGDNSLIENDTRIGKNCRIGNRVRITKGIKLPDFSNVPDDTIIDAQEKAGRYSIISGR